MLIKDISCDREKLSILLGFRLPLFTHLTLVKSFRKKPIREKSSLAKYKISERANVFIYEYTLSLKIPAHTDPIPQIPNCPPLLS